MSNSFQFNPFLPLGWTFAVFVLLLAFFVWKETQRVQPYLVLRLIAQAIMLASLVAMLLRPTYSSSVAKPDILLLTPGYSASRIDSLLGKQPTLKLLATEEAAAYPKAVKTSYRQLEKEGRLRFVAGDGVPLPMLETLDSTSFTFLASPNPSGVISIYQQTHRVNRKNKLSGTIRINGSTRMQLRGPGGPEDSVSFRSRGEYPFEMTFFAKEPGRFVYSFIVTDSLGTRTEDLPVEIEAERRLNILFLQQYPGAETRFLKNFLISKGHRLSVRYQISKNNFRYEFANRPEQDFRKLTTDILNSTDLVITDEEAIRLLSPLEKEAIRTSVGDGLGLLNIFHDPSSDEFLTRMLPMGSDPEALDTISFPIAGFGSFTHPFVPIKPRDGDLIQPLTVAGERVLTGFRFMGDGKAGFQLLLETYRLSLSGSIDAYATHWSPLLEQVARKERRKFTTRVVTAFPVYENEPVDVEVVSSGEEPTLFHEGKRVPLTEDVLTDDLWRGRIWATSPGWHAFTLNDQSVTSVAYFVSKAGGWRSIRGEEQLKANRILAIGDVSGGSEFTPVMESVSPVIFFILFLLAAGFLWLAPKL